MTWRNGIYMTHMVNPSKSNIFYWLAVNTVLWRLSFNLKNCFPFKSYNNQSCIADQSLSWVRRSDQFIAMIWEKSSDQSSCLNLNLTFYLKLTSDHCAKCVTVIWCDLKIKAKVQVQAWTLIWTFFSDHRNELILIWTLWTIYNSVYIYSFHIFIVSTSHCRA